MPVAGVRQPGEHEGGGQKEGEGRIADGHEGQGEQCQGKQSRRGGKLRVERPGQYRGQNAAAHSAADAFEPAAQGAGDMGLEHDERGHQQPVAMVDVEEQDEGDIEAADERNPDGVAQGERGAGQVGGQQVEVQALAKLADALVHIAEMPDGGQRPAGTEAFAEAYLSGTFNGGFKQGGRLGDLGEQKAPAGIDLAETSLKKVGQLLHLLALQPCRFDGVTAAAHQQSGYPELGGAQLVEAGNAAFHTGGGGGGVSGLRLKVLGEGDGAGDEHVGVFKQDDQMMAGGGFGEMLGADIGHGVPSMLDGAADAVLVMPGEAVPEGGALLVAAGEIGHGTEEGGQFAITVADGGAGRGGKRPEATGRGRARQPRRRRRAAGAPSPWLRASWRRECRLRR